MLTRTKLATQPQSIWTATAPDQRFEPLGREITADVAIVGGGITGVLCAYLLRHENLRTVLLEAEGIGESSTGNSTGNLYAVVGDPQLLLRNEELAGRICRARSKAVDFIAEIVERERIDCDFERRPWVLFAEGDAGKKAFDSYHHMTECAGFEMREIGDDLPFPVTGAIALDNQAQFNPAAFTRGLAAAIQSDNCLLFERSRAMSISPGDICRIETAQGRVKARWVILATHTPKGVLKVQTLIAPYREYGIATLVKESRLPRGIFWSAERPRHSIRSYSARGHDHLIVVGEEHKTGQNDDTESCYQRLADFAGRHFQLESVPYRWSAQAYRAVDGVPHIGESAIAPNVLMATGYAADGLTYAAVAAPLLVDRIMNRDNPLAALFATNRFDVLASAKNFMLENVNVMTHYLADVPGKADAGSFADIANGEGKTVSVGGEKLAAHRDDQGRLHVVSAVCTHMQCIVNWNGAERSWDCPCHGSRFAPDGTVIEGPAMTDLPARDVPDHEPEGG